MVVDLDDLIEVRLRVPSATIEAQLQHHLDNGLNAKEAAERVLQYYEGTPMRAYVVNVVLDEAQRMERGRIRHIENMALSPNRNAVVGEGSEKNRKADRHRDAYLRARGKISRQAFAYEKGKSATWGEAVEWQHAARITWQMTISDGIGRDIARHRRAIDLIQHYHVSRLDEIPNWEEKFGLDWDEESRGITPEEADQYVEDRRRAELQAKAA